MKNATGTITLVGSGEFGESMARVYRAVLALAPAEPNAVFLDTPAGFELNADAIATKAADYFSQRLNLPIQTASYKKQSRATAIELEFALRSLRRADFIFAGPGSPSYAIRNWRGTPVWEMILNRFGQGAHLVFASAAAIAVGASALPVYEIYKAGDELYWLEGLNLCSALDLKLAIVPHWNNAEGGTFDTRYCYMGEERFLELESQLDPDTVVLGIDEYTACTFYASSAQVSVMGAGRVTIRCDKSEQSYGSGESFPIALLRRGGEAAADITVQESPAVDAASDGTTRYLLQLARALDEAEEPEVKRDLIDRAHETMHELSAGGMHAPHPESQEELAQYVETVIEIRNKLRDAKQYSLADEIRDRLAELDIVIEDGSAGTRWRKG